MRWCWMTWFRKGECSRLSAQHNDHNTPSATCMTQIVHDLEGYLLFPFRSYKSSRYRNLVFGRPKIQNNKWVCCIPITALHMWVCCTPISPDVILCGWLGLKHQLTALLSLYYTCEYAALLALYYTCEYAALLALYSTCEYAAFLSLYPTCEYAALLPRVTRPIIQTSNDLIAIIVYPTTTMSALLEPRTERPQNKLIKLGSNYWLPPK